MGRQQQKPQERFHRTQGKYFPKILWNMFITLLGSDILFYATDNLS